MASEIIKLWILLYRILKPFLDKQHRCKSFNVQLQNKTFWHFCDKKKTLEARTYTSKYLKTLLDGNINGNKTLSSLHRDIQKTRPMPPSIEEDLCMNKEPLDLPLDAVAFRFFDGLRCFETNR